jgi:hypothetical protein
MTFKDFAEQHVGDATTREAIIKNPCAGDGFDPESDADVRTLLGIAYENGGTAIGVAEIIRQIDIERCMNLLRDVVRDAKFIARVRYFSKN